MGIQQGCLLAPLPFLLVTDILDIAIVQNSRIWPTPSQISGPGEQILGCCRQFDGISAKGGETIEVVNIVRLFGDLSRLFAQPAKRVLIFLKTAVEFTGYKGIPVLRHGDSTRYLGYQVGTENLIDANWRYGSGMSRDGWPQRPAFRLA